MAVRSDEFMKQVNELWSQAVDQLEEVKAIISDRVEGRVEAEVARLRSERDKLLLKLGEETYNLVNTGNLPMPTFVKGYVDRLSEVIDRIVEVEKKSKRKAASKKKAPAKKVAAKKSTVKKKTRKKKTTKKKATKKKVAKKSTAKKSTARKASPAKKAPARRKAPLKKKRVAKKTSTKKSA